jgi:hypothetical protein
MFRIRWPHVEAERLEGLLHSTDSALTRHYGLKATGLKQQMTHGLLGMAGALTVSSLPHRTSPVLRGKWVRETLLGSTPPPPPCGRARARPEDGRREVKIEPRATGNAPPERGLCLVPRQHRSDRLWIGELGPSRPLAHRGRRPAELKTVLLQRTDDFVRQLRTKMLGYREFVHQLCVTIVQWRSNTATISQRY